MDVFEKLKVQFDLLFAFAWTDAEHHLPYKDQVKVRFYPMLPDFRNSTAFWKVPRLRPFMFLVRSAGRR
jgi:hypothetical protein